MPGGDGDRRPVGEFPARFPVGEVEPQRCCPQPIQRRREPAEEGMLHPGASPVGHHNGCGWIIRAGVHSRDIDVAHREGQGHF